jgi:hypothetical protein
MRTLRASLALVCGLLFTGLTVFIGGLESLEGTEPGSHASKEETMDVRLTYGPAGSTRCGELIAGEELNVTVSLAGVSLAPSGKIECAIDGELTSATGETVIDIPVSRISDKPWLGDASIVQHFSYVISANTAPGRYKLTLRVHDRRGIKQVERSLSLEILSHRTFGAANIGLFHDEKGTFPAAGVFAVGTNVNLKFLLVGCDTNEGKLSVENTVTVVNDKGNTVCPEPIVTILEKQLGDPADRVAVIKGLPARYQFGLTHAGKFWIKMKLRDKISNSFKVYDIPIVVVPSP